jgi:hypothetical protein
MKEFMKEFIEYLKKRTAEIVQNDEPKSVGHIEAGFGCVISYDQAKIIIDFYEKTVNVSEYTEQEKNCKGCMGPCGQCKDEMPNAPNITPEWDKIDSCYLWASIDKSGVESLHMAEPEMDNCSWWSGRFYFQQTGRIFNMAGIDWTKTLSKRPAK